MYFIEALLSTVHFIIFYITARYLFNRFINKEDIALVPLLIQTFFGALVFFSIQYYFVSSKIEVADQKEEVVLSGQALRVEEFKKPLVKDVDFVKNQTSEQEVLTTIETSLGVYTFSSYGAQLVSASMKWQHGSTINLLSSNNPSLLIAFDQNTPYLYTLLRQWHDQQDDCFVLEYQSIVDGNPTTKTIKIYNNKYQIDILLNRDELDKVLPVRLFCAMPDQEEAIQGFVNKAEHPSSLQMINVAKQASLQQCWAQPTIFGLSTKFLVSACCASSKDATLRAYFKEQNKNNYVSIIESAPTSCASTMSWTIYLGPKTEKAVTAVSENLKNSVEYGWLTFLVRWLVYILEYLKNISFIGNYGCAIILLVVLLKLILLPFTLKTEKSLKEQAEFEKKRQYLQQKYKNDKQALDQAMSELLQKHGASMISGCLPMLLNIPIFIAFNTMLSSSILLYGSSFLWLPNLALKDPYYILSCLMFVGMMMSASPVQNKASQSFSKFGFGLLIAAVISYLGSGLALFITVNTLLGVVQTFLVRKFTAFARSH